MPRTPITDEDIARPIPTYKATEWRSANRLIGYRITLSGQDMPDSEYRFPILDRDRGCPDTARDCAEMRAELLNRRAGIT